MGGGKSGRKRAFEKLILNRFLGRGYDPVPPG
jgi:hypothetical protein